MKKSYLVGGAILLAIIIVGGSFWYNQQSSNFVAQIDQSTSSIFELHFSSKTPLTVASTTTPISSATSSPISTTTHHVAATPPAAPVSNSNPIPDIISFSPSSATVGSTVTIEGVNFSRTANYIMFGVSAGRHFKDGSPDTQIAIVPSTNGNKLTFTVPTTGPSGLLCGTNGTCSEVTGARITPGSYPISVRSANGTSVEATFTVSPQ
jgi:hypothetical protein